MKKFAALLFVLTLMLSCVFFASCGGNYEGGLNYTSNGDGTCNVSCNDKNYKGDLIIPEFAPNGEKVVAIADYGFEKCEQITGVTVNANLVSVGKYAFYGCSALKAIRIPIRSKASGHMPFLYAARCNRRFCRLRLIHFLREFL